MSSKQDRDIRETVAILMPLIKKHNLPNVLMAIRGICGAMEEKKEQDAAYWKTANALLKPVVEELQAITPKT